MIPDVTRLPRHISAFDIQTEKKCCVHVKTLDSISYTVLIASLHYIENTDKCNYKRLLRRQKAIEKYLLYLKHEEAI